MLPVLSRMLDEDWRGSRVLYVCPAASAAEQPRARLEQLRAAWSVGASALWHGDVGQPRDAH